MTERSTGLKKTDVQFVSLWPFLFMTFLIAWGIIALYIFLPAMMNRIFGKLSGQHPLFYLAVYAPAIAAVTIVIVKGRIRGLKRFLSRLLIGRCSPYWYLFLLIGVPLVFYAGSMLKGNLFAGPFPFSSFQSVLLAMLFMLIKGPVEEFGWRGLALPLLQRKLVPFWAGLILGIIWGFWHLPAFLLSGTPQSAWSFTPFFIGSVALSVIVTPLFNSSKGSILLPALFHFMIINPVWPDAAPYDTYIFVAVAVLIVWLNRKTMFTKEAAVTQVIP